MTNFDGSLPALAAFVLRHLGEDSLAKGVAIRDISGRLAFISHVSIPKTTKEKLEKGIRLALGSYARRDRAIADVSDFGAASLLDDSSAATVEAGGNSIRLLDRRLVGADWMRVPKEPISGCAVVVFGSIKGGVGRSTALSVVALDQARRGRRVIAIDLDLEAPGIGSMLLTDATTPKYGSLDYLVEMQVGGVSDDIKADLVGPSPLARQQGKIDVLPAYGLASINNPGEVLAKLSRAYAESVDVEGKPRTFLDHVRGLVEGFATSGSYDLVLVDARAGLHESTAAAIAGLGAEVLLFGLDEPQTYRGYEALFGHMTRYFKNSPELASWVERLTMVEGKRRNEDSGFTPQKWASVFSGESIGAGGGDMSVPLPAEPFHDVPWDDDAFSSLEVVDEMAAIRVASIGYDARFRAFDPMRRNELLARDVYSSVFGELLDVVDQSVVSALGERVP